MVCDFLLDILLGGGSKALHSWQYCLLLCGKFTDKASGVQIIRAKIMSPT